MKKDKNIKFGRKQIYTVNYETTDPLAKILIVHGLGEHIGRYERFSRQMNEHRLSVFGFDNLGHGKSGGNRGNTSIEDSLKLIELMVKEMKAQNHDIPLGIFGHSLGGLIALRYLQKDKSTFYSAAISAPAIILGEDKKRKMEKNAFIAKLLPFLIIDNEIKHEDISRNHTEVVDYSLDELVHPKVSLKLAMSLYNNVKTVNEKAAQVITPTLLLKGTADNIVPYDDIEKFFEKIGSPNKTFSKYPGAYHETIYDPEHGEQFRQDVIGWFRTTL